jgi:hypothetical protein
MKRLSIGGIDSSPKFKEASMNLAARSISLHRER